MYLVTMHLPVYLALVAIVLAISATDWGVDCWADTARTAAVWVGTVVSLVTVVSVGIEVTVGRETTVLMVVKVVTEVTLVAVVKVVTVVTDITFSDSIDCR